MGAYMVAFCQTGMGGGGFDFESTLSLQANVVFGFGKQDQAHSRLDASVGIGLTGVQLNTKNSNVTEARTASAFTASVGLCESLHRLQTLVCSSERTCLERMTAR